ncbi:MAG TPA: TadE family protein [Candidatus Limnocylindrales bacterium]|nr:TadE family protein [Candidatus Limnocylindrales bacterium]
MRLIRRESGSGQALVEFALVFPIFLLVMMSIIVFGVYVFYNQQLENAAREAARYAATHSASAQCPTVSRVDPVESVRYDSYTRGCDAPEDGWPKLTSAARGSVWGMPSNAVRVSACWSGLVDGSIPPNADALAAPGATFAECTINRVNPRTNPESIPCPPPATIPPSSPYKADGDDKASSTAAFRPQGSPAPSQTPAPQQQYPTTVTVYACYVWTPPLSGFLFVPAQITMRAVVTEAMQRQQ